MGLDQHIVDTLVSLVRQTYPEWKSFDDERTVKEERQYKVEAVEKAVGADGLLVESALREDIEGRAFESIIERFDSVGRATNLLYQAVPMAGDLNALYLAREGEPEVLERFCKALLDLLWGEGSSPERLGRYSSFVAAENLPNKWTFPTYFLFVTHPHEDLFVKPGIMRKLAKKLATPWTAQGSPSAEEYAAILAWADELRGALEPCGAQDMIDVQSLLWVAGSELEGGDPRPLPSPHCWKIAPGKAAWNWDACRSGGFITIGWEALGNVGAMSREEFQAAQAAAVAETDDWSVSGTEQVWHFAHDIGIGDLIVANKGKSEVLGFGRVTGPYEYLDGVRHGHHLPVEWFDVRPRQLPEPNHGWMRTLVGMERAEFDALLAVPPAVTDVVLPEGKGETAFTGRAHELLERFSADPTKAFYAANKDELTKYVQEPVQELLLAAGERVAPPLQEALETKNRLFSIFIKNDHGRGGAWPYYWGAFYPVGGKKTEGCQLYVFLDEQGLSYGFSIGNYASEDRKRFARNAEEHRESIVAALRETINTPDFEFGNQDESDRNRITQGIEGLDLAGWLDQGNKVGPHVHVVAPWQELLSVEREQLIDNVANAFDRLFPLMLLCTSDDPMPSVRAYMDDELEFNPPYSLDDLAAETSLPKENLAAWLRAIERKGQAILYGPPGTGKTYVAERLAKHMVAGGTGAAELVQFHPAYAYEDFMQGMRPKARDGGGLDYPIVDGRFKQFCEQARGRKGLSVPVIDEVNRANLARVFGELMYLLEYRDKTIPLAAGGRFSIPANVRLIGTMNTADRSIALVDHALRRRFAFLPLYPDYQMLTSYHAKNGDGYDPAKLIEVLKDLNRKIGDHHYEVGTSFFMRPDIAEQLPDVWSMEIEPYLEEYFFDQQGTVDSFRWDEVKKRLGMD